MDTIFLGGQPMNRIDKGSLHQIKGLALQSPRRSARYCLHAGHDDPVQQMVIAIQPGACTMPHRQPGRRKSYMVVDGELLVLFFSEDGTPNRTIEIAAPPSDSPCLLSFLSDVYHTTLCLGRPVVYVETIDGPFRAERTQWAAWAPRLDDEPALRRYVAKLTAVDGRLAANWPDGIPRC
jgi:cupin fold WbuC family metalloprotein